MSNIINLSAAERCTPFYASNTGIGEPVAYKYYIRSEPRPVLVYELSKPRTPWTIRFPKEQDAITGKQAARIMKDVLGLQKLYPYVGLEETLLKVKGIS